ncbi:MAG: RNA polymerase subunit sigma-70 [Armatimonadetes bacterium]|nr:MAG: RNA polymerase subunit sigma-70 [Armatimonadota bacterium]
MVQSLTRALSRSDENQKEWFESLVKDSFRSAYGFAYRLTGNSTDAEDLVQETYLRAYRFFHRYDEDLPFLNWLYRIMSNAHVDTVRRRGRLRTTSLEQTVFGGTTTLEIPDDEASPEAELMQNAMGEHVEAGLQAMNPEFRTAVLLADVEGMAYEEIASIMGTSVGTVRSRIHRGRKQLKRLLRKRCPAQYGGESGVV